MSMDDININNTSQHATTMALYSHVHRCMLVWRPS